MSTVTCTHPPSHVHVHRHMYTSTITRTCPPTHVRVHRHMYTSTVTCTHPPSHVHIHRHMYTFTVTHTCMSTVTRTNTGNELPNHIRSYSGPSFGLTNWRKIIGQSIYDVRHLTTSYSVCFHKWSCCLCREVSAATSFTSLFN